MRRSLLMAAVVTMTVLLSACGSGIITTAGDAPTLGSAPSTTATAPPLPEDPASPATTETVNGEAVENTPQASWNDRHVVIYGNYATENTSAIRYLAASSDDVGSLVDETLRILGFDLPFGVKVRNGQIDISDGPNFPAPRVIWPIECLGVAPDIDGDALLDDCDPYPTDGPLADWDGDDVVNPEDNCPTVFNPDQAVIGERSSGTACDGREGIGAETWAVVPTITLEDWNAVRADRGLDPLVMPTGAAPLPPEVADWCAGTFDDTDGDAGSLHRLARAIPDAYGLNSDQRLRFFELATQQNALLAEYEARADADVETLLEAAGSHEQLAADFLALEQAAQSLQSQMEPYFAPLVDSDLACDLDR